MTRDKAIALTIAASYSWLAFVHTQGGWNTDSNSQELADAIKLLDPDQDLDPARIMGQVLTSLDGTRHRKS